MPEPRVPSRQGPPSPMKNINDEEDPMAKALADLRRDPPPPGSVRRNASHRRAESVVSAAGSVRSSMYGHGVKSPASPAPNRMSFQQSAPAQSRSPPIDSTLSPPPGGHTAAALAKSMDEFRHQSSRGPESKRQSVNYSNFADDVVGSHPTSRPTTPSFPPASPRAPSPAMMQAPKQPATHIADEVLSQYHQAFPGERETRSRSRAGSIMSNVSRNSYIEQQQHQQAPPSPGVQPRQGFVGIGAGNAARSPSPQPPVFRSPDPSPVITPSTLGPQNLGISLDAKGGVAQDTMAEQYRRQYQQQQAQAQAQQSAAQPTQAPAPRWAAILDNELHNMVSLHLVLHLLLLLHPQATDQRMDSRRDRQQLLLLPWVRRQSQAIDQRRATGSSNSFLLSRLMPLKHNLRLHRLLTKPPACIQSVLLSCSTATFAIPSTAEPGAST